MTVKTMARLHEGEARMKCIKSFNLTPFELTRSNVYIFVRGAKCYLNLLKLVKSMKTKGHWQYCTVA